MSSKQLCSILVALLCSAAAPSFAQDPPAEEAEAPAAEPETTTAEAAEADDSEGESETTDEVPMGTPQPVSTEASTNAAAAQPAAASEPAPDPEGNAEAVPEVTVNMPAADRVDSKWNRNATGDSAKYRWTFDLGGYLRTGYTGIQNDATGTFGRHDGFVLANARLSLEGHMRSAGFRLQLDGAVNEQSEANDPNGKIVTRLKDAVVYWGPLDFLKLTVGQFKPPYDVEEQVSTANQMFALRSVGSRGVSGVEGYNVRGLSADREVGALLGSDGWYPTSEDNAAEGFGLSYGLAVTNGQSANHALNDNDALAGYGRLGLHWGDLVRVGGGYFMNDRTLGVAPDLIEERRAGWTADLTFTGFGVTLIGSAMSETVSRPALDGVDPDQSALAYQVQLGYREPFFGFQPAFRYAFYDPSSAPTDAANPIFENDALTHYTVGLNYIPDYPVRVMFNYTIAQEQEQRSLDNNRVDLLLQAAW